jgi:lipoprotein-anchoring transpeptidase ErfK/SrfK
MSSPSCAVMKKTSFLISLLILELECLVFAVLGFFILTDPALALFGSTTVPAQEVLWSPMNIPKPAITPSQIVPPPPAADLAPVEAPTPTEVTLPSEAADPVVDDGSLFPDDGRWIEVNLSQQQLNAYEGDVLVNTFIVSTGLPDTPTVTGEYRIYVKVPLQDMSGPGYYLTDVPWVMFFYEDYGLHGTYWHNNFGSPMSRGCVNLSVDDAAWLYNWASVGTPVSVHY